MVYGRTFGDQELSFEASGALMDASLVMRDRETDSWWSIITSTAIGGELDGAHLETLPVSEKATWHQWRAAHPDTLVLSIEGEEHVENNPYDNYFASDGTFRDLQVADTRLEPKEPVYTFWLNDLPYAAPHNLFGGGAFFDVSNAKGGGLFLYREAGASMFASTVGYLVGEKILMNRPDPATILDLLERGETDGLTPVGGFDTFWYNWVAVHEDTRIVE